VSLRVLTNLRLAYLRLTTAQQRTTGQNLPSGLYNTRLQHDYVGQQTFANDTAVVTMVSDPAIATQNSFKKWRMKANESKSIQLTFTTRRCPPVHINSGQLPQKKISSILGFTLTGDLPGTNTFSENRNS
jgi:hypothetical protein